MDEDSNASPDRIPIGISQAIDDYSMNRQIEEFKKKIEEEIKKDHVLLAQIPEENTSENDNYKTPSQKEKESNSNNQNEEAADHNEKYENNSLFSSFIDEPVKLEESVDEISNGNRNTEVNMEWEDIVREATDRKAQNRGTELTLKESQYLDYLNQRR